MSLTPEEGTLFADIRKAVIAHEEEGRLQIVHDLKGDGVGWSAESLAILNGEESPLQFATHTPLNEATISIIEGETLVPSSTSSDAVHEAAPIPTPSTSNSDTRITVIVGAAGSGKTLLARYLLSKTANPDQASRPRVDCQDAFIVDLRTIGAEVEYHIDNRLVVSCSSMPAGWHLTLGDEHANALIQRIDEVYTFVKSKQFIRFPSYAAYKAYWNTPIKETHPQLRGASWMRLAHTPFNQE